MVTSRSSTALFVQLGGMVTERVGVSVISGVGVRVGGTKTTWVGGNVAVTNPSGAGVGASPTCTEMQEASRVAIRRKRTVFFIV